MRALRTYFPRFDWRVLAVPLTSTGGTADACLAVNPDCNLTRTHLTSALPIPLSPSRLDDDAWDDLLNFIEEKRVIPIIGPELLKVETDTGPRLLYDWLAEKLAAKLNVDTTR